MELHYGIKQPLRIFEVLEHKLSYQDGYNVGVFKLLSPLDKIPPFQIEREPGLTQISSLKLVDASGNKTEIISTLAANQLSLFPFSNSDRLIHYGDAAHGTSIIPGLYYLEISDGNKIWFSEDITFVDIPENLGGCALTKITYWDTCDVADIFYRTLDQDGKQYKNIIYLDVDIGKPQYELTEEGEDDAEGNFEAEYLRLTKEYNLEGIYPEFFIDALQVIPLHLQTGEVQVLTERGYLGLVESLNISAPDWQGTKGIWAKTSLNFSTEFVNKTNCCGSLESPLVDCIRDSLEFVAEVEQGTADYLNYEYTPATGGIFKIPFEDNDLVMIKFLSGERQILRFTANPPMYNPQLSTQGNGDGATDLNLQTNLPFDKPNSFYWTSLNSYIKKPTIDGLSQDAQTLEYTIWGKSYKNCTVKVTAFTGGGTSQLVASGLGYDYINPAIGIKFQAPANTQALKIECVGLNCELGESDNFNILINDPTGIGVMVVEGSFIVT